MQQVAGARSPVNRCRQAQLGEAFAVAEGDRAQHPPARAEAQVRLLRRGQAAVGAGLAGAGAAARRDRGEVERAAPPADRRRASVAWALSSKASRPSTRTALEHLEAIALVAPGEAHPDVAPAAVRRPRAGAGSAGRGSRRRRSRPAPPAPPRRARGSRCRAGARRPTAVRCSSSTQWLGRGKRRRRRSGAPSASKLAASRSGGAAGSRAAFGASPRRSASAVAAMPTSLQMPQSMATTARPAAARGSWRRR